MTQTPVSGLWAVCVLPGDGPEFQFATTRRHRLRALRRLLRRFRREVPR